jgi:alkyl sulfatase BDS1-like metallo-beta-lactamase superfamily hydrolase
VSERADASVTLNRSTMDAVVLQETTLADEVASGGVRIEGDAAAFEDFLGLLDDFEFWFNIVTP